MNSHKMALLRKTLKEGGASLTQSRLVVFDLLDNKDPQSMNELVRLSKGQLDKASLYRTINLYERIGVINRVNFGFKYKVELSDSFSDHHHHLTCMRCGRIVNAEEDNRLEDIIEELAGSYSFSPTSHQLEIQGICEPCRLKA
jgi:Fur family ferric uptake transcriptional regulator